MDFLVYSDIEHTDNEEIETLILQVEDQITRYAIDQKINTIFFCGDRFKTRNPHPALRDKADEILWKRSQLNIEQFQLIGNHDYYNKSGLVNNYGVHSIVSIPGVFVFTNPCVIKHNRLQIIAIPNGYYPKDVLQYLISNFGMNPLPSVVLFHDLVNGCTVSTKEYKSDFNLDCLDYSNFLFLGGDNHTVQQLPLKKATGVYVGNPLQIKSDDDDNKGFWHFRLENDTFKLIGFIASAVPKLAVHTISVKELDTILNYDFTKERVIIKLQDDPGRLEKLNIEEIKHAIKGAYSVKIEKLPVIAFKETIPELTKTKTYLEDIYVFIDKSDTFDLDKQQLKDMAKEILEQ